MGAYERMNAELDRTYEEALAYVKANYPEDKEPEITARAIAGMNAFLKDLRGELA